MSVLDIWTVFSDDAWTTGFEESLVDLLESRTETVFGVFLPRVLLSVERKPESDVPGTLTCLFP